MRGILVCVALIVVSSCGVVERPSVSTRVIGSSPSEARFSFNPGWPVSAVIVKDSDSGFGLDLSSECQPNLLGTAARLEAGIHADDIDVEYISTRLGASLVLHVTDDAWLATGVLVEWGAGGPDSRGTLEIGWYF